MRTMEQLKDENKPRFEAANSQPVPQMACPALPTIADHADESCLTTDLPSIIVVNFNTRELTLASLRSLQLHEPHAQLIVVDNASTDGSADAVAEEFPDICLLRLSQNIGFGRANMVGLQVAKRDVIVLFNSDAEVSDDALSRCIRRLTSDPKLGAVTPRLRGADGAEQNTKHAVPVFADTLRRALWGRPMVADARDYWIPGTCMLLKRSAIEDAGGLFDHQLFMYWEDADLCARLKKAGYSLAVVEDAEILHHGGASGGGPNCTAKAGLHEWYTYGRHVWFSRHRPAMEAILLWILEFVDAFRCMGRALVRADRRQEFNYGRVLLKTLVRRLYGAAPTFAISDTHARRDSELIVGHAGKNRFISRVPLLDVGAVVIGRNEGNRLRRCLLSLLQSEVPIVYVDSGSTDGSRDLARYLGVTVVDLDLKSAFTAARARNAGMQELMRRHPRLKFIQFVDGDCEVCGDWLRSAREMLMEDPSRAIVCGSLSERQPEKSIYNRLCQIEWRKSIGAIESSGGIFLGRVVALQQVDGFNDHLIAGEEPEMCLRLRRIGWKIHGCALLMAKHDAAMMRFGQWWKRTVRAGHSYAEAYAMHGRSSDQFRRREIRSILVWGVAAPLITLVTAWPSYGLSVFLLLMAYRRLFVKVRAAKQQQGERREDAAIYATFVVLGKVPQAVGVFRYWANRLLRRRSTVIEYK